MPARPAWCHVDWGYGISLARTGRAYVLCAGDTVQDPNGLVLPYGQTARFGAVRCTASEQGLECRNGDGHGFFLSRATQRIF